MPGILRISSAPPPSKIRSGFAPNTSTASAPVWFNPTGILNNELYIGRLVWNRLHYVKDPETDKRISRLNPESEWIVKDVPELRIVPQDLWERVKARQSSVKRSRGDTADRPFWNRRRPRYLFSGLVRCGCCGGGYSMIGARLLGCSTARLKGTCNNRLTIRRDVLEASVLDGLRHHLVDPALSEAFCAEFTRETNRLRMQEQASKVSVANELEKVKRDMKRIIEAIKNGVPPLSIKDEMIALEERKQQLTAKLEAAPEEKPLLHPNLAKLYRRKVADLTEALNNDDTRAEAFELIGSLVEEIVLVPEDGALKIELRGDLAGILTLCTQSKNPSGLSPEGLEQVKMVAEGGFVSHGLWPCSSTSAHCASCRTGGSFTLPPHPKTTKSGRWGPGFIDLVAGEGFVQGDVRPQNSSRSR